MRVSSSLAVFAALAGTCFLACSDNTSTLGAIGDTQSIGGQGGAAGSPAEGSPLGGSSGTAGGAAIGGSSALGGSSGTGGATALGGSSGTGGGTALGGSSGTGGGIALGGSSGTGGATALGGSSGTGGATALGGSSGTGGSTALGGSGGSTSVCGELTLDGPARGIDLVVSDTRRELSPVLVRSNSGFAATLVYHWTSWPGGTITGVRFLPFKPFDAWPTTDFGPTLGGEPYYRNAPIAAASGFGSDGTDGYNVAVLAHDPGLGAETGDMTFVAGASPPFAQLQPIVLESLDQGTPAFVATSDTRHFVGYGKTSTDGAGVTRSVLRGGFVEGGKYQKDNLLSDQACALSPLAADAIPSGQSFLLAHSTSRLDCASPSGADGLPTQVSVRLVGGALQKVFPGDRAVTFVKLVAKKGGGAWLLVGRANDALPATIELAQLDAAGTWTGPITIATHTAGHTVTAEALGDDLVVATHRATTGGSAIDLAVFGPNGGGATTTTLELSTLFADRVPTLLGSKTGTQIVVAWSEPDFQEPPTTLESDHIKVARFARTCPTP